MKYEKYNKFIYGFAPGLLLPILFVVFYLKRFYPIPEVSVVDMIGQLFPSVVLGKLLLLSMMPNLVGVFIFYKQDSFQLGIGMMVGALPYLALAMYMM